MLCFGRLSEMIMSSKCLIFLPLDFVRKFFRWRVCSCEFPAYLWFLKPHVLNVVILVFYFSGLFLYVCVPPSLIFIRNCKFCFAAVHYTWRRCGKIIDHVVMGGSSWTPTTWASTQAAAPQQDTARTSSSSAHTLSSRIRSSQPRRMNLLFSWASWGFRMVCPRLDSCTARIQAWQARGGKRNRVTGSWIPRNVWFSAQLKRYNFELVPRDTGQISSQALLSVDPTCKMLPPR